jgi:hypothetical protein
MESTILNRSSEGEEIRQEVNLAQGLARKRNHQIGNRHKGVVRVAALNPTTTPPTRKSPITMLIRS